jgi:hypothetical protein
MPEPEPGPPLGSPTSDDTTLGGYLESHGRPPAFLGSDGHPYSVSIESERCPDLRKPWEGYLVFVRWNDEGLGVIGHLESPTLFAGRTREEVESTARALRIVDVQDRLEAAIARTRDDDPQT